MDVFIVPVPLFSANMNVVAYQFFMHHNGNIHPQKAGRNGGDPIEPALEILDGVGIEPFAMDKPVFVPIGHQSLVGRLDRRIDEEARQRIVFVLGPDVPCEQPYLKHLARLGKLGFRFALRGADDPSDRLPLLRLCHYWFVDQAKGVPSWISNRPQDLRHLVLVATNIGTQQLFAELSRTRVYTLFEGTFYRFSSKPGQSRITPLKVNMIRLLNIVQDPDFEFSEVAAIIQRDTALSISLFNMVNSPYFKRPHEIGSIGQAVSLLGEIEIRKWASTAVAMILGSDMPDEITRISLMRAKFAENLAEAARLRMHSQSLFLMGLFSVLDAVLQVPMQDAVSMVKVSTAIRQALVDGEGEFAPVLEVVRLYEAAEWQQLARVLLMNGLSADAVGDAYINAALWYRDLIIESYGADIGKGFQA